MLVKDEQAMMIIIISSYGLLMCVCFFDPLCPDEDLSVLKFIGLFRL